MLLDGIFGSEAIDSSGEILDVEGADISDLEDGKGVFNWEHRGEDAHGASPNDIVGKILYAKKIFKRSDCETDRERAYWDEVKMPFIYGVGRLYDAAGHPGAIALAAQIRDHHANNEPILVRFSVEGSTLEKKNNRLLRSVIRRVALTLKPCNKTAHSGLLSDPNAPDGFDKAPEKKTAKDLLEIETQKFEHPNFSKLGSAFEVQYSPLNANALAKNKQELATLVKSLAKLKALQKIHSIVNAPELPLYLEYEDLEKGERLPHYLKFMGNHPKAQETAEWAENNLNHRNLAEFAMRHAKTKPEGLSDEEKTTIKHFGDSLHMPEVQNAAGQLNNKHNFETGIQLLQNAQDEYSKRHAASAPKLTPVEGKKLLDLGDGVAVYHLPLNEERKNENEATAMSNCGTPHKGGELWSIRKDHGNGMVEPMVTIAHEGGYIGEVKGKYNWKPHPRYHPYIAKLMASDLVKGFVGGGYAPESNFEFSDMKDGLRNKLLEYKPALTAKVYKELLPQGFQGGYNHVPEVKSIFNSNDVKAQIKFLKRHKPGSGVHRNAAKNPNISQEALHHLVTVNKPGSDVHRNAVQNPKISPELLHHLVTTNEPGSYVHRNAAENPNISQETLHHLVTTNEPGYWVHWNAALNPKISQELLHHLVTVNEPGSGVHAYAALNPKISQELLHHLVTTNKPGSGVHQNAASNPNISQELLHHLVTVNEPGSIVHWNAASNPNISKETLHHLVTVNKPGSLVHENAALNPNISQEALHHLVTVNKPGSGVHWNAASNPKISPELLHHLVTVNKPGSKVHENAAENPQFSKLPLETQKMVRQGLRPLIGENIQKIISMINDENNPEQAKIAQRELLARRKARYDKILSPEGNLEELQHLAESHDADISKRARAELKRRGLSKSIKNLDTLKKINKAIAAGTGAGVAAPSALASDEALKKMKNGFVSAFRDFKKPFQKAEFKQFLKHYLPECDDEYLDRFADLAEDVKLNKSEKTKKPKKTAKTPSLNENDTADLESVKAPKIKFLTVRGTQIATPQQEQGWSFDENDGTLHTPIGSIPHYNPADPHPLHRGSKKDLQTFNSIMTDPRVEEFHGRAMVNWVKFNEHARNGTLPPEAIMHATLFSQLSPNTPVPIQENMYGHLVDSMRHTGIDARSSRFGEIKPDWISRDQGTRYPELSTDYFRGLGEGLHLKRRSQKTGRKAGEIKSFQLATNKFKNMSRYHEMHDALVGLMNTHKADAASAARELMLHKHLGALHAKKRQGRLENHQEDIGPYTGINVFGLAPKTSRYTFGMLGGENVLVPDTHFVRHSFGLDLDLDADTINYIKSGLWDAKNSHVLEAMDRYFAKKHPAVQHMLEHPVWGKHFGGDPQRAVFPAFWKTWLAIAPHELARGYTTKQAFNMSTDHTPFWEATIPLLNKSESNSESLPLKTAKIHKQWVHQYGEIPALMMYYRYLVPKLLASAEKRDKGYDIVKSQALSIELKKAVAEVDKPESKWLVSHMSHAIAGLANEPEQQELINGLDLTDIDHNEPNSWVQLKNGQLGCVKSDWSCSEFNRAKKEAAFYNVAKNVFGLVQYVPIASAIKNPNGDLDHVVVQGVPDSEPANMGTSNTLFGHQADTINELGDSGELDKLMVMDMVMGNNARHPLNMLFSKSGSKLHLINHDELGGISLMEPPDTVPAYISAYANQKGHDWATRQFHASAANWLMRTNLQKLEKVLHASGVPEVHAKEALRRLLAAKKHIRDNAAKATCGSIFLSAFQPNMDATIKDGEE